MRIGVPREIKPQEGRVALLAGEVRELADDGHEVFVERGAGILSGVTDADYAAAGATLLDDGTAVYQSARLIAKVKEVLPQEYGALRPDHIVMTNIHGALNRNEVDRFLEVGLTAIALEDTHRYGSPNCALAGEIGAFEGLRLVFAPNGGTGRHLFTHFGAPPIEAAVVGLGNVGRGALRTLLAFDVDVIGLDIDRGARGRAELDWSGRRFRSGDIDILSGLLDRLDLVINCVLWPKHRNDHLVNRADLGRMKPGAAIIDISCDEAGAIETSRPTSWRDPVYLEEGIRHFCVDNIPGAVPVAASAGYARAILPHIRHVAGEGALEACRHDPWLRRGLTCADGTLTHAETARIQKRDHVPVDRFLGIEAA
ncbi:alanine dehydrogenase [Oceanibacterium hippocampi]|uniref:Alanine dehydrogenase n=1 Tax=Oceanibacterium hippocampi TaxID=745714 RepID=A0A1Y5RMJ9_9PROT|nr:NAD(P)-dependent oxidoreductase [Oceanibacterium hippocampi]SLN19830.1 Alanine dehydrogenase [Oceanibacterium hippocampi]